MIKETLNEGALVPLPQYDMGQVEQSWVNFHVSEASKHASARALEIEGECLLPWEMLVELFL